MGTGDYAAGGRAQRGPQTRARSVRRSGGWASVGIGCCRRAAIGIGGSGRAGGGGRDVADSACGRRVDVACGWGMADSACAHAGARARTAQRLCIAPRAQGRRGAVHPPRSARGGRTAGRCAARGGRAGGPAPGGGRDEADIVACARGAADSAWHCAHTCWRARAPPVHGTAARGQVVGGSEGWGS